ncbi:hypothetical protein V6O07_05195, partial [Arthrospira platensis SPKY2]
MKADLLSLTNYRAMQNPGLKAVYELIVGGNRHAMSIKNKANQKLRNYLNPRLEVGSVKLGDGVSKSEKTVIDEVIYIAQRAATSKFKLSPSARRPDLVQVVDGVPQINETYVEQLRKQGRLTLDQLRKGVTYTVKVDKVIDDAQQKVLLAERDAALAVATTPADKAAITKEYQELIDGGTYTVDEERTFPGIPGLTEDSPIWREYQNARDVMEWV